MYTKQLPKISNIVFVSKLVKHYPTYAHSVQAIARRQALPTQVVDFLDLFPQDEVFESEEDLVNRCGELELLIEEEREAPVEFLRSP